MIDESLCYAQHDQYSYYYTSHKSTTNVGITIHYSMEYKSSDLTVCRYRIIYKITPRYLQLQYGRYGM